MHKVQEKILCSWFWVSCNNFISTTALSKMQQFKNKTFQIGRWFRFLLQTHLGTNGKEWVNGKYLLCWRKTKTIIQENYKKKTPIFRKNILFFDIIRNNQWFSVFNIRQFFTPFSTKQHEIESFLKHTNSKTQKS